MLPSKGGFCRESALFRIVFGFPEKQRLGNDRPEAPAQPSGVRRKEMRPKDADDKLAELTEGEIAKLLCEHVPYRLQHLLDAVHRIPARCIADNQAFEAGAVAGRSLLSLLGITYDPITDGINDDRNHRFREGMTDDIKAPDLGGRFVERDTLTQGETVLLAKFIRGVHKSSAHFTWKSDHKLDVDTYQKAALLIYRLLKDHIPHIVYPVRSGKA